MWPYTYPWAFKIPLWGEANTEMLNPVPTIPLADDLTTTPSRPVRYTSNLTAALTTMFSERFISRTYVTGFSTSILMTVKIMSSVFVS